MNGRTTKRGRWQREPYRPPELIHKADYSTVAFVVILAVSIPWLTNLRPQTHAVYIDIPVAGEFDNTMSWEPRANEPVHVISPRASGAIEWNGDAITFRELVPHLQNGLMQPIEPWIAFAPDPLARYELVAQVLSVIKESGVSKFCFAGLEDHQHFDAGSQTFRLNVTLLAPTELSVVEPSEPIAPATDPPPCSLPTDPSN